MFSVFKNEWVKILFNKKTVVTIIIMLAADVFMLLIYLSKDDISYRTYTDYKEAALLGGTELADIQEGEYDETVFNYIIGEMSSAESYASYVENTIDGADASMNISIFMNEFDINNAAKTKEDYAILKNADVRFVGGYGIEKLMGFPAAEIIIVLLLCVAVSHLVIDEKKSGMMSMLKPTKHGGVALVSAKMSAAAFYGAFLSAVLSLANICIVITLYGKVDMSANIQSVKMFRGCGTDISIGHFLLYYILIKCLAYVFVAVLFTAAAVACSNHIYFYVVCAGMAALSVIFFYAGSFETGNMFLRRMNIIYYLSGGKMFLYFNYNIFNNPVHILTANILVMIVGIIFCAATAVVLYARATTDYRQFSFPIRIKGRSRIYGLWTLENYKFYAGYRVAVVFIAAVITQLYIYHGKEVHWYADEIMYRNYICSIEGEYTEEKRDYIYGELETANEAVKRADELDKLLLAGEITEDEFNREYQSIEGWLNKQYPLEKCAEYIDYVANLPEKDRYILYGRSWYMLAGENDYAEDFANALVLMAALCLGLPYIISENYRYGMDRLEGTCIRSRRSIRYRLIMTAIYTALCFAAAYIPQIIWLNRDLGFTHIDYPLACIMKLAGISLDVSIAGYFAVVYAIRFFVALVAAYIIALSGFIIKKSEYIMAASFAVFTVPVIIKILGLDVLDMISLNRLLSGNMLFRG